LIIQRKSGIRLFFSLYLTLNSKLMQNNAS
jgi:hypothetical protein